MTLEQKEMLAAVILHHGPEEGGFLSIDVDDRTGEILEVRVNGQAIDWCSTVHILESTLDD